MWLNASLITIVGLSGLANLLLAGYVYIKNPKARVNRHFFYFGFALFLYCEINLMFLLFPNLFWLRLAFSVGPFVPLTGTFFTYDLSGQKINKWFQTILTVICFAFLLVNICTPLLIKSIVSVADLGYEMVPGPLFQSCLIFLLFMILVTLAVPVNVLKKVDSKKRTQILYFLTGAGLDAGCLTITTIILPYFGITKLANIDPPFSILLVGFTSYAIIKYNLMDIKSLFFKAFIYSLMIIGIIVPLLGLMFAASYLFARSMIWPFYVIATLAAIVLFFIGKLFFSEKRDLEKVKINLTELLQISEKNRTDAETERDKTVTIIKSFSDGLIVLNEKKEIFSINPEAEKILELESSSLYKKPLQSLVNFPKAMMVLSVLNSGFNNILKKEIDLEKDFIVELSVIPLKLAEKDIGHLIILHDVSRQKMIEKMKTEFVSLSAHQLRTPLTAVNWSLGMLKNGDFGKVSNKQKEIIETTLVSNNRLISLVNDILNITRIEEGKYLSETTMSDMREIVNIVIDNYKIEIEKRKIKIQFEKSDNLPLTMVDVEKIKLVVQNLIDNAIKYSPNGGKVIITLESDERNIQFKIQDFGIGIPQSQQNSVFTKFFRADNAGKVDPNGTGLGLFLAENIVKAHKGRMWFESKEDVGTSIIFSLPIVTK